MGNEWKGILNKIDEYRYEIPKAYKPFMRVPGIIFADEKLIEDILKDQSPEQVANVASLPGIIKYSLAMPDIHWGYGFPIGGVAAMSKKEGVISPGGVGYDINCGVRLIRTNLAKDDVMPKIRDLVDELFAKIPAGVGSEGELRVKGKELEEVLEKGAQWAVTEGYGWKEDLEHIEENGRITYANSDKLSRRAKERGEYQLGTLGSGNHFLEIQVVSRVFEPEIADRFGIFPDQIMIMVHTGSRGLGYQVAEDYIRVMSNAMRKYGIELPDKQLACAPFDSPEGQDYFQAMCAAANFAWANRQMITHWVREVFEEVLREGADKLGMRLIYDVAHNIAKLEEHNVDGKMEEVVVHRKGATRAFPAGHPDLPADYKDIGQPVIIPGDMGRSSFLLIGLPKAMEISFGSTCHGAGRTQSRSKLLKSGRKASDIEKELLERGIIVKAASKASVVEEASEAYKNVVDVVNVVHNAGISKRVAQMKPLAVIKG
ncbi:MAG: RtcB family protein [Dictyoglomaceae bacterium]